MKTFTYKRRTNRGLTVMMAIFPCSCGKPLVTITADAVNRSRFSSYTRTTHASSVFFSSFFSEATKCGQDSGYGFRIKGNVVAANCRNVRHQIKATLYASIPPTKHLFLQNEKEEKKLFKLKLNYW